MARAQYIRKILRLPSSTVQLMLLVVTLQIFIPCVSQAGIALFIIHIITPEICATPL